MDTFRDRLREGAILLFDGSMGIELLRRGLSPGPNWNEERPDTVLAVHRDYRDAGAQVIITNTLVANRVYLERSGQAGKVERYNTLGVELARQAGAPFVAGDLSSTGELLEPYGRLTQAQAADAFDEQAQCLERAGVDLFIVETMSDPAELLLAVKAIRRRSDRPVVACMAFDEVRDGQRTMMGTTVSQAAQAMASSGAEAIGINCGNLSLEGAERVTRQLRACTSLPLIVQPNAGTPALEGGRAVYRLGSEAFAQGMIRIVRAGARLVGGCCGTTPQHIAALARLLREERLMA